LINILEEAPDDFACAVAKALAEHRQPFQVQLEPYYYVPDTLASSIAIPIHPGAMQFYRERRLK
jgi:TRAP-type uncharacterized transport system substrate-binding protein